MFTKSPSQARNKGCSAMPCPGMYTVIRSSISPSITNQAQGRSSRSPSRIRSSPVSNVMISGDSLPKSQ